MGLPPFSLLTSPPQAKGFQGRTLSHTLAPAVVMSFSQTSCLNKLFIHRDGQLLLSWAGQHLSIPPLFGVTFLRAP